MDLPIKVSKPKKTEKVPGEALIHIWQLALAGYHI
jgi:hypothetical protein